jgi:hypothetical protein
MKLISMTDFVLKNTYTNEIVKDFKGVLIKHCNYAEFLKQPLELWMFVPCDEDGNVISEKYSAKENTENKSFAKLSNEYKEAKERCLFEGVDLEIANLFCFAYETIEELIYCELKLTKSAIKQIR